MEVYEGKIENQRGRRVSVKIIDYANVLKFQEEVVFFIIAPKRVEISYDSYSYYRKRLEEIANARNILLP